MEVVSLIKQYTPWPLRYIARLIRRELNWMISRRKPAATVFEQVYTERRWADDGSAFHSGPGSIGMASELYGATISKFISEHQIRSVVDLGCGDFRVAQLFLNDSIDYVGIDIVAPLIAHNETRFASDNVRFLCRDITSDELPNGELCLLREVLQHLSNREIALVLEQVKKYPYVIYTDYQPAGALKIVPNKDMAHGCDTRIWRDSGVFLDQPPFSQDTELLLEVPSEHTLRAPGEIIRTFLLRRR
jgi:SAM-dependent methyltransferase